MPDAPAATPVLREPARSKCTRTSHESQENLIGHLEVKCRIPRAQNPFCASLLRRNAHGWACRKTRFWQKSSGRMPPTPDTMSINQRALARTRRTLTAATLLKWKWKGPKVELSWALEFEQEREFLTRSMESACYFLKFGNVRGYCYPSCYRHVFPYSNQLYIYIYIHMILYTINILSHDLDGLQLFSGFFQSRSFRKCQAGRC